MEAEAIAEGVCYWTDGTGERILFLRPGNRLIAVDANSGKLIESFGDYGKVDLTQNLGRDPHSVSVNVNSPGDVIFKDLIILGKHWRNARSYSSV